MIGIAAFFIRGVVMNLLLILIELPLKESAIIGYFQ